MTIECRARRHVRSALLLGGTLGIGTAAMAANCTDLATVAPQDSTVDSATLVKGPSTIGGASTTVTFCRVQGTARPSADSEIKFEVWLPTAQDWTSQMKVDGTGGYSGAIPYASLARDVGDGIVTAGSNMGHDGGESPDWVLGHPEKVRDWGLRAHYYVATAAKTLADALYGKPVKYSYFEGCSNGGRQALMMAQNYPTLFDGIVAGAPSNFYPDVLFWLLYSGKVQTPVLNGPPVLSAVKAHLVTQRVLGACDAQDGLVDGQITNPRSCKFDVDTMGPAGDGTLTAQELGVAKAMYGGTVTEAGEQRYAGANLGSESDWIPTFGDAGGYGIFIANYVYNELAPPFDWRKDVNFTTVYDYSRTILDPVTTAPSPDLTAFRAHGGKLIQLAGMNDPIVPPDGSIDYTRALALFEKFKALPKAAFDRQVEALTPAGVAAVAGALGPDVRTYHRLFMLPAVAHCGGSTGPDAVGGGLTEPPAAYRDADHHATRAVMKWVEQGVAPDQIIATKFAGTTPTRSRPICPWPNQAVYKGSGDIDDATNFTCATLQEKASDVTTRDMLLIENSLRQRALELPNR